MTGQIYTFRNLGDEISNGITGDLNIQVVIAPHKDFKVLDRDLHYEVEVSVLDMILGTQIEVPHFDGKVNAKIPPLSDVTQNFNLRGKGMNAQSGKGDLIIKPIIRMPKSLSEEDKETLSNLKDSKTSKF